MYVPFMTRMVEPSGAIETALSRLAKSAPLDATDTVKFESQGFGELITFTLRPFDNVVCDPTNPNGFEPGEFL